MKLNITITEIPTPETSVECYACNQMPRPSALLPDGVSLEVSTGDPAALLEQAEGFLLRSLTFCAGCATMPSTTGVLAKLDGLEQQVEKLRDKVAARDTQIRDHALERTRLEAVILDAASKMDDVLDVAHRLKSVTMGIEKFADGFAPRWPRGLRGRMKDARRLLEKLSGGGAQ